MPLEIAYRPVVLDFAGTAPDAPGDAVPAAGYAAFAMAAQNQAEPRARDFVARIRQRDTVSYRRMLHRPARLRQRIAGIILIGLLPALLAALGWGDPRGITGAAAQDKTWHVPSPVSRQFAPVTPAVLADVHSDAEPSAPIGPSARPLLLAGSSLDRWRALQCLTTAIYYEAAREPDDGQRAVAQVVLNRVAHAAFPKTVCGVVFQGSERSGCQFSFACDGSLARRPMAQWWERARRVAETALAGNVYTPIGLATHYHTSAVHPAWADTMAFLGTIGAHRFYRWNGGAGQTQAFAAVYTGNEPLAAPHPHDFTTSDADLADAVVLQKAFEAGRLTALRETPATVAPALPGQPPALAPPGPNASPARPTVAPETPRPSSCPDRAPCAPKPSSNMTAPRTGSISRGPDRRRYRHLHRCELK